MAENVTEKIERKCTGSDADLQCTPCAHEEVVESAIKYCGVCKEYLCATCVKCHKKFAATRGHVLVDREYAAGTSFEEQNTSDHISSGNKVNCRLHPTADVTNYCQIHDSVFCSLCAATEHRTCHGVCTVVEASSKSDKLADEFNALHADSNRSITTMKDTMKILNDMVSKADENAEHIRLEIEDTRKKLVHKIHALCDKANEELSEKTLHIQDTISHDMVLINNMKTELSDTLKIIEENQESDKVRKFITAKNGKKTLSIAQQLNQDIASKSVESVACRRECLLSDPLLEATTLFSITGQENSRENTTKRQEKSTKRSYDISAHRNVLVKLHNEVNNIFISDLCQTDDGKIVIADYWNKTLKLYDYSECTRLHGLTASPTGVCCIGGNNVAVKLSNNTVLLFDVSTRTETRTFPIRKGGSLGLAYCDSKLWMSVGEGLDVYDLSGSFVKTVKKDTELSGFQQISSGCSKPIVFVADSKEGSACYDTTSGKYLQRYELPNPMYPRGVCTASDGTVFVSDMNANKIAMFKEDGTYIRTLIEPDKCITQPVALLYDALKHRLFVSSNCKSDSIQVVEFT